MGTLPAGLANNNNGCGLFMTPVEFPATSAIDPAYTTSVAGEEGDCECAEYER